MTQMDELHESFTGFSFVPLASFVLFVILSITNGLEFFVLFVSFVLIRDSLCDKGKEKEPCW